MHTPLSISPPYTYSESLFLSYKQQHLPPLPLYPLIPPTMKFTPALPLLTLPLTLATAATAYVPAVVPGQDACSYVRALGDEVRNFLQDPTPTPKCGFGGLRRMDECNVRKFVDAAGD